MLFLLLVITTSSLHVENVLEKCRNDDKCSRKFYLDSQIYDFKLFSYLFRRFAVEIDALDFLNDQHMFVNNVSASEKEQIFILAMRSANFCTENEVADDTGGCTCRQGKICQESAPDEFNADSATLILIFVFFLVAVVYYSNAHLRELRELRMQKKIIA